VGRREGVVKSVRDYLVELRDYFHERAKMQETCSSIPVRAEARHARDMIEATLDEIDAQSEKGSGR
jgi:hypothetical protein